LHFKRMDITPQGVGKSIMVEKVTMTLEAGIISALVYAIIAKVR